MATILGVWNAALREIGERNLTDTGEGVEAARVLADVYNDVVTDCLTEGQWNFATRTVMVESDTGVTPAFGPQEVFAKPDDWLRTTALSAEEELQTPLERYLDDVDYWSADVTPIYVRYISNSADWGFNLANWPRAFTRFVELSLALRVCERLSQNQSKWDRLADQVKEAKRKALSQDAMNEAQPKYSPMGSWNAARGGGNGGDRGSRSRLIG